MANTKIQTENVEQNGLEQIHYELLCLKEGKRRALKGQGGKDSTYNDIAEGIKNVLKGLKIYSLMNDEKNLIINYGSKKFKIKTIHTETFYEMAASLVATAILIDEIIEAEILVPMTGAYCEKFKLYVGTKPFESEEFSKLINAMNKEEPKKVKVLESLEVKTGGRL